MIGFNEMCEVLQDDKLGRFLKAKRLIRSGEVLLTEGPTLIVPSCNERRCTNCFSVTYNQCRFVIAARQIRAGEVFHVEGPSLTFPISNEKRCTNCLRLTKIDCRKCHVFPLCDRCPSHFDFECDFFAQIKNVPSDLLSTNMYVFGVVRCLLLNENPKTAHIFEEFKSLEAHQEERRGTDIWSDITKDVVEPILSSGIVSHFKRTQNINEELIQQICGLIDVNSFEIRAPDMGSLRAIYLKASLLDHDCMANTSIAIDEKNQMKIFANCDVEEGAMLTYCYTNPLLGTDERRLSLKVGKYFHCQCRRCEDPSELGSHMSSLLCTGCTDGVVVHKGTQWICEKCNSTFEEDNVDRILTKAKAEIILTKDDLHRCENLIAKFSKVFHPNHYLIIDLKQNVAAILRSFLMNPTCRPGKLVLERKTVLCEDILAVLRIVQPGISRLKAIALYEMFTSYAELNRLRFHKNEITELELLEVLQEGEVMLREAIRMLLHEPPCTPEGQLTRNMMKELRDLQNDMKMLSK